MQEHELRVALSRLESAEPVPTPTARRAKSAMFAAFDALDSLDGVELDAVEGEVEAVWTEPAAEITLLLRPEPPRLRRRRLWVAIPAAAAILVLVLLAGQIGNRDRFDPSRVVAADTTTDSAAVPADSGEDRPPDDVEPFLDTDLPRAIDGRFETMVLGGKVSFVTDGPMWLTHHETGLIVLSLDPQDPLAAEMIIARPLEPTVSLEAGSLVEFLLAQSGAVGGQAKPIVVDGLEAMYWRGRSVGVATESDGCSASEVCLVLFEAPVPIGIRPGINNDLVELSLPNGDTVLLLASIPFDEFDLEPFGAAFDGVVATIDFSDVEDSGPNG